MSAKGFTANEIVDMVTGRYAVPIRWVNPCRVERDCLRLGKCEDVSALSVMGTTTVLNADLTETGEPAVVPTPGPGQAGCAMDMRVPARLTLRSDDDAIDAEVDVDIWSDCGNAASVSYKGPVNLLGGKLANELPEAAMVELTLGATWRQEAWLGIYVTVGATPSSNGTLLLRSELVSEEECPTEVPKDEVFLGR